MTEYLLPFEKIKRKILVKKEAETDNKLGCKPEERTTEEIINYGIVNINKPQGPTSHQVSDYVQKILGITKSGHSGTLDPHVHGVLPIALGRATRIVQALLKAGKEYVGIMHLHKDIEEEKVKLVIKKHFIGKIKQIPPLKSAVKREERTREIYYFDILEKQEKDVLFITGCEAGTYIRKLCLHPKTEILSRGGFIIASDFYFNPQTIYSFNKGKMIEKNPSATQKLHSPTKLLKITMSSGVNFIITPDHELLKSSVKDYEMVEARKLSKGDFLVKSLIFPNITKDYIVSDLLDDRFLIPQQDIKQDCKKAFIRKYGSIRAMYRKLKIDRKAFLSTSKNAITIRHLKLAGIYDAVKNKIKTFKTEKGTIISLDKLNTKLFYLLGLVASDGNNTKEKKTIRYTRLKFHNKNEELVDVFLKEYKKLFPSISISKKKVQEELFQLDTSNSFFATIAASLGIKSPQKNSDIVPILYSRREFVKAFLKGYFDGDGTAYFKKKDDKAGHYSNIRLYCSNYTNIKRIHQMLLKIGISNRIIVTNDFDNGVMYGTEINDLASKQKFAKEIGSNHPRKICYMKQILTLKTNEIDDHYYIGLHFKHFIKERKKKLHKMGGNLNRILTCPIPLTRGFYKRCSKLTKLPALDSFIIEKVVKVEEINGGGYVYDMTIPDTHNFLMETGFVSSNCHDLGQKLKTGAHMLELRRTKAGPFTEDNLFTLQDLTDAFYFYKNENNDKFLRKIIQPVENGVKHLPKIWVFDTTIETLCHGADLNIPGIIKLNDQINKEDIVAIMTLKDELIALGNAKLSSEEIMKNDKGLAVKTEKVFMEPGVYRID